MKALIFDCDGVLADTERDGHRVAFNRAFTQQGYKFQWDEALYGKLLKIAGGKERMRYYFDRHGWPDDAEDRDTLIAQLHKSKTEHFMKILESGQIPLRSGVARLVDEAVSSGISLAICSTSNEKAVNLLVEKLLGRKRKEAFAAILAGDVVKRKKPDPEIYLLAAQKLGVNPADCVVVEDSRNGLLAAKAAGMKCVITKNGYTENEDFSEADLVVAELGDPPRVNVSIETLKVLTKNKRV
ncbi:MAG: HAD family hydrolase [Kiritimatiellia bacterium]|nr:HAD family hydrolase [Kiritimatiellia bacterium]